MIRRQLVKLDEGNTLWQRDLAIGLGEIADTKRVKGDAEGALASYDGSLAIFRRLADADKANADWQHDISVALDKIGYLKFRQRTRQAL